MGELVGQALNAAGKDIREHLYRNVFTGKPNIKYDRRKDVLNRSLVSYQVYNKSDGLRLSIGSYAANLYEKGRRLRSGKRERPLRIFSKVLPPVARKIVAKKSKELENKIGKLL